VGELVVVFFHAKIKFMAYTKVGEPITFTLSEVHAFNKSMKEQGMSVIGDPIGLPAAIASLPLGTIFSASLSAQTVNAIVLQDNSVDDKPKKIVLPLYSFTCQYGEFQSPLPTWAIEQLLNNAKVEINFIRTVRKEKASVEATKAGATASAPEQQFEHKFKVGG